MIKTRLAQQLPVKSHRWFETPEKYTKRGELRKEWLVSLEQLQARMESRLAQAQERLDTGDDWDQHQEEWVFDSYSNRWTFTIHNERGNLVGLLEES